MRAVIQRVSHACVKVETKTIGSIEKGYLVLLGVTDSDTKEDVQRIVKKLVNLRIFSDENDKIDEIQVISNNGEIIKSKNFNSNLAKLEFTLKSNKNKFYYIKVIRNNDKISVTAPIWIE